MLINSKFISDLEQKNGKILILGVGGVSMSSIAMTLKRQGFEVLGYDSTQGVFTKIVEECGIPVCFDVEKIDTQNVICAVYTAAIKEDSDLIKGLRKKGIECVVRAEFLGELMKSYKNRVGVCGTHGKSTVSGMIASIFMKEFDPTVMIGAGLKGLVGGFRAGDNEDFVFEACEYKDSFLSFSPTVSVVLNVELDHTDYFKSLEQMKESFVKFMDIAHSNGGVAIVNFDNVNARECALQSGGETVFYSAVSDKADVYAKNISEKRGCFSFDVFVKGEFFTRVDLSVAGEFQIGNALAAVAASYLRGVSPDTVLCALSEYTGVSRRFEFRKFYNGAEIRDDYAHHPDEIRATLSSCKNMGFERIFVVYQPHTYTRTHDLFEDFSKAFDGCDEVVFADIYAAREVNVSGVTSKLLAESTPNGKYVGDFEQISEYMRAKLREGDLLIIMGAGDIINLEI